MILVTGGESEPISARQVGASRCESNASARVPATHGSQGVVPDKVSRITSAFSTSDLARMVWS